MGVYIKGMKMPECCGYCPIEYKNYCMVKPYLEVKHANRHPRCPLIEVPEPHGDLIDKNELTLCSYDLDNYFWFQAVPEETLNEARVVIPASEKEGE